MKPLFINATLLLSLLSSFVFAQNNSETSIANYIESNYKELGLKKEDVSNWTITSQNTSKQSGITHVYIRQEYQGIPVFNGLANFAIKEGKVVVAGNRLISNLSALVKSSAPNLTPEDAIKTAAKLLQMETPKNLKVLETKSAQHLIYTNGEIAKENIPVQLMYYAVTSTDVRLVWDLSIYTLDAKHWWSLQMDAQTGELVNKNDWVVDCHFDQAPFTSASKTTSKSMVSGNITQTESLLNPDHYMVVKLPLESPNHGPLSIVIDPADSIASPFGWHDNDGVQGAEYNITRGNNVFAYDDINDDDLPGFSPSGGPTLTFNFPYSISNPPLTNQSAAITNLFYMNNMMHDIWYKNGFDEASGNFQFNNYGNGGSAGDYVNAEAQDGGGTNNANFATPPDGQNPRMQMYLWNASQTQGNYLEVNSPVGIAGTYNATTANFGPGLPSTPITAGIELLIDTTFPLNDGCETIVNGSQLAGKIALIDRGSCTFVSKVEAAQNEGAVAVIIINNVGGAPITMGGASGLITIPSLMISLADGTILKNQLDLDTVIATISNGGVVATDKDGDFDNGIIAHEYGHGISNRLTGGPSNSNCLTNSEQMGEGWSDWFGLMLTIEPGDQGIDGRGIGTYATSQPTIGNGIRPAPYSTDFSINNYTYGASNNTAQISEPHGVGFIFATALWDLNWALIAHYGGTPDPDVYNGVGGNNIAMKLIIEGLKLQPCSPGMIDGRDAILQADQLLYNGIHECLIWKAFAKRGFGYSADQGSSADRTDQIEAFDIPPTCTIATAAPIAAFTPSSLASCSPIIDFTDSSTFNPQAWLWNFGDGTTSTLQNATHTFTSGGVFTVKLIVSNTVGSDSTTQQITIAPPPSASTNDIFVCAGDTAFVTTSVSGIPRWRNSSNTIIHVGDTLLLANVNATQTYYVENTVGDTSQFVGPVDASIGTGGNYSANYHGAINFTADKSFEIVSAWVTAFGAGPRTIYLASGVNSNGVKPVGAQIVDKVTVNLVDGPQRVNLNLLVPAAGDFNLGAHLSNLYRNTNGAVYPYTLANCMQINSSSSINQNFYFYFYDLEVRYPQCASLLDTFEVNPIVTNFNFVTNGDTVTFTDASVAASSWFWSFGDGNTSLLQNPTHIYATSGFYTVSLAINGGGCSKTSTVNIGSVGIGEPTGNSVQFELFPNPATTETRLILNQNLENLSHLFIYSMDGKQVKSITLAAGVKDVVISLRDLMPQLYMVVLRNEKEEIRKKLFVH